MIIYVDGDSCPVIQIICEIAKVEKIKTYIIRSFAHFSNTKDEQYIKYIYVDSLKEAVDYKIISLIKRNDLVITQDFGLASLCLQKNAICLHPKGLIYNEENIERLLHMRYLSQLKRNSGAKVKGPKKFTNKDKQHFKRTLYKLIHESIRKNSH